MIAPLSAPDPPPPLIEISGAEIALLAVGLFLTLIVLAVFAVVLWRARGEGQR